MFSYHDASHILDTCIVLLTEPTEAREWHRKRHNTSFE